MLSVLTFRTPDEAVEKANNTPYGLSAGVWTDKGSRILWMANQLRAGVVWANTFNKFDPTSPFGGYKESGYGREGGRHGLEAYLQSDDRIDVRKTYKLYIGGAFPRSESGRSYEVNDAKGKFVANAALASRKDARDAVVAARKAFRGWSGRTAYNRGQILYRVAEVMEDRRPQFVEAVRPVRGPHRGPGRARSSTPPSTGWSGTPAGPTRSPRCVGGANPVAGPFFNLSTPEPTGVVAVLAPQESSLLGLVSVVAPVIVTGNTVVVVSSYDRPLPAVTFAEVLATSDVPGGVVNILTGSAATVAPVAGLAHGRQRDRPRPASPATPTSPTALEVAAAENLKRVRRAPAAEPDWTADPGLDAMTAFLETKTVWHPIGV